MCHQTWKMSLGYPCGARESSPTNRCVSWKPRTPNRQRRTLPLQQRAGWQHELSRDSFLGAPSTPGRVCQKYQDYPIASSIVAQATAVTRLRLASWTLLKRRRLRDPLLRSCEGDAVAVLAGLEAERGLKGPWLSWRLRDQALSWGKERLQSWPDRGRTPRSCVSVRCVSLRVRPSDRARRP